MFLEQHRPWMKLRILSDPRWEARQIGTTDDPFTLGTIWDVTRKPQS